MARRSHDKLDQHAVETESLSERIRGLISLATLEERRKSHAGKRSGPAGERRRRSDENSPERQAD